MIKGKFKKYQYKIPKQYQNWKNARPEFCISLEIQLYEVDTSTEVTWPLKYHLQRLNTSCVCQGKSPCFIPSKYSLLEGQVQKLHVIGQVFSIPEAFIWYLAVSCLFDLIRILLSLVKGAVPIVSVDLFVQFPL